MVDIKNKKCLECDKQPSYNNIGQKGGIYCFAHKKDVLIY
jgi:hypothetical protein